MQRLLTGAVFIAALLSAGQVSARESWVGLNVRAQVIYFETNKLSSLNWGPGADASFFPFKRLLFEGRYSISSFSNENASNYKSYYEVDASPKIKPFSYYEASVQLNLICNTGRYTNSSSHVDSTHSEYHPLSNSTTITEYSHKESWLASEHQLYGIRAGLYGLQSGMAADVGDDADTIRTAGGVIVDPNMADLTYTNHKMTGFFVGIAKTRVYYEEGLWRTFFIDALFKSKTEYRDPELKGFTERKWGARVGIEGTRRGIGGRIEGGLRPGVAKGYVLTQLTFGFML